MKIDGMAFERGVLWAAAFVSRDCREPSMALDILTNSGINKKDAVKAGCDQEDIDLLFGQERVSDGT